MEFTYVVFNVTCNGVKLPVAEFKYVVFRVPSDGVYVRCIY